MLRDRAPSTSVRLSVSFQLKTSIYPLSPIHPIYNMGLFFGFKIKNFIKRTRFKKNIEAIKTTVMLDLNNILKIDL